MANPADRVSRIFFFVIMGFVVGAFAAVALGRDISGIVRLFSDVALPMVLLLIVLFAILSIKEGF